MLNDGLLRLFAKEIVEKLNINYHCDEDCMNSFLDSEVSKENKEKVLEQLYLLQLYSNAYVGPDPRVKLKLLCAGDLILSAKNDEEVLGRMKRLEFSVKIMQSAETHPLSTFKSRIEDSAKYIDCKF